MKGISVVSRQLALVKGYKQRMQVRLRTHGGFSTNLDYQVYAAKAVPHDQGAVCSLSPS